MDLITADDAIAVLEQAVAERGPDYQYQPPANGYVKPDGSTGAGCAYVHTESDGSQAPGCIAGVALYNAGVPLALLTQFEGRSAYMFAPESRETGELTGVVLPIRVTSDAASVLDVAQSYQDDGRTWGEAFDLAKRFTETGLR